MYINITSYKKKSFNQIYKKKISYIKTHNLEVFKSMIKSFQSYIKIVPIPLFIKLIYNKKPLTAFRLQNNLCQFNTWTQISKGYSEPELFSWF